jgi:membrane dipeptidase
MNRATAVASTCLLFLVACAGATPESAKPPAAPTAHVAVATTPAPAPSVPATAPATAPSALTTKPTKPETIEERAARLHKEAIIVDGHDDIPTVMFGASTDLAHPGKTTHTDLARMKSGGITGEFFSIYVEGELAEHPTVREGGSLRRAIDLIDLTYREVEKYPADLMLATSVADIRRAKKEGKIAVLMGVEGGHAIENSLAALRILHRLGCRYMTLTHTNSNEWADSSGSGGGPPPVRHHGLTPFGEEVVHEMQRIGMLVDVSHVSDETFWNVMKIAKTPVIASHSSARAIADHRRNLSDDMLRAMGKNGGVVMVNFWSMFLSNDYAKAGGKWFAKNGKAFEEIKKKYLHTDPQRFHDELEKLKAAGDPLPKVPLSAIVDHIDHIVKVAGIDHVGLGSDFDGVDALPEGLTGIGDLPKITLELVKRGYSDEDVLKILGENFLRVLGQAEAFAHATGTTLSGDGSLKKL